MAKAVFRLTLIVLLLVVALAAWNYVGVYGPSRAALAKEGSSPRVTALVYRQYGLSPNTVVFDVWSIKEDATFPDVARVLFRTAVALKDREFDRVILARNGSARFYLEGTYFRELARDVETQSPVYVLRTLPQNVYTLAGVPAYETWTGGMLGVLTNQLEDLDAFREAWLFKP